MRHLNNRAAQKTSTAKARCNKNGFDFVPCIIDYFGKYQSEAEKVNAALVKHGASKGFWKGKEVQLRKQIQQKISMTVAKAREEQYLRKIRLNDAVPQAERAREGGEEIAVYRIVGFVTGETAAARMLTKSQLHQAIRM